MTLRFPAKVPEVDSPPKFEDSPPKFPRESLTIPRQSLQSAQNICIVGSPTLGDTAKVWLPRQSAFTAEVWQ